MPPVFLFPANRLNEVLPIARTIATQNAGQPMYRADIFVALKRSPESGPSHNLVTASGNFGLTKGGYTAKQLSLTDLGRRAVIDGDPQASVEAVLNIAIFRKFFEKYADSPLPGAVPAKSFLAENGIPANRAEACLTILLDSGRDCGLVQTFGQSERIVSAERAIQGRPTVALVADTPSPSPDAAHTTGSMGEADGARTQRIPTIHFNIEVHLPADATAETYDAIFSSMRKYLIDVGE